MIETVAHCASTNRSLLARLAAGEHCDENHWLVADRQSAGRGRAGRAWLDSPGNFMGSTVARLVPGDQPAPTLALVAGVALTRAVLAEAGTLPGLALKWPNDLLVDGAKLAGILLERQGDAVVVGIGVNLASAPTLPDRATIALAALGHAVPRDRFAHRLAQHWGAALADWHRGGWPALRAAWQTFAHPRGTLLSVRDPHQEALIGAFAGLDDDGAARLALADGEQRVIHAGDIEWVGV